MKVSARNLKGRWPFKLRVCLQGHWPFKLRKMQVEGRVRARFPPDFPGR